MKGNEFFCEVDEDYIRDDFNLSGLGTQVPYYEYALDVVTDSYSRKNELLTATQEADVEAAAEALFGLIHSRFIITAKGLNAMLEKYRCCDFGRCPRVLCHGQPCLPVGLSDIPRTSTVKLFCPRCEDVYYPRSKLQGNIDGAYFGTTFPHLFLMSFPELRPEKTSATKETYIPRVFGFKLSPLAYDIESNSKNGKKTVGKKTEEESSKQGQLGASGIVNSGSLAGPSGSKQSDEQKSKKSKN